MHADLDFAGVFRHAVDLRLARGQIALRLGVVGVIVGERLEQRQALPVKGQGVRRIGLCVAELGVEDGQLAHQRRIVGRFVGQGIEICERGARHKVAGGRASVLVRKVGDQGLRQAASLVEALPGSAFGGEGAIALGPRLFAVLDREP